MTAGRSEWGQWPSPGVIPVGPQPLASLARPLGPAARGAGPSAGSGLWTTEITVVRLTLVHPDIRGCANRVSLNPQKAAAFWRENPRTCASQIRSEWRSLDRHRAIDEQLPLAGKFSSSYTLGTARQDHPRSVAAQAALTMQSSVLLTRYPNSAGLRKAHA
jgi:hypothetical protein